MRKLHELRDEACWGKLTKEEFRYVEKRIESERENDSHHQLHELLYILGRGTVSAGPTPAQKKLMKSFLDHKGFSIAEIALYSMCNYWGYVDECVDAIKQYIRDPFWDDSNDVQDLAFRKAGEHIRGELDIEFSSLLIEIFEDPSRANCTRANAYNTIAKVIGKRGRFTDAIPDLVYYFDYDCEELIDMSIIEEVKEIVAEKIREKREKIVQWNSKKIATLRRSE